MESRQAKYTLLALAFCSIPIIVLGIWYRGVQIHRDRSVELYWRVRTLNLATLEYAEAHHNRLPPANSWEAALKPYVAKLGGNTGDFAAYPSQTTLRFAINKLYAGQKLSSIPDSGQTMLYFPSISTGKNIAEDTSLLNVLNTTGENEVVIGFAYGHADTYGKSSTEYQAEANISPDNRAVGSGATRAKGKQYRLMY